LKKRLLIPFPLTFIKEKNVPSLQSKANHTAKSVILHDKHHVIKSSFDAKRIFFHVILQFVSALIL